jgi:hypothetical protein
MKIRPTHPIFLEDVTVNRHIFLLDLMYDMLAMEVQWDVDINNAKTQPAQIHFHPDIVLLCIIIKFIFLKESYHFEVL